MSITDELRDYAEIVPRLTSDLDAIADRIDAEHERAMAAAALIAGVPMTDEAMAEHGFVRLPKDADGEPIRIGDMLEEVDHDSRGSVGEMRLLGDGWWVFVNGIGKRPDSYRYHKQPTVEDVLREFADEMNQNLGMYTGEAIDADEWRSADNKTIADFAAKLRLAGDAE